MKLNKLTYGFLTLIVTVISSNTQDRGRGGKLLSKSEVTKKYDQNGDGTLDYREKMSFLRSLNENQRESYRRTFFQDNQNRGTQEVDRDADWAREAMEHYREAQNQQNPSAPKANVPNWLKTMDKNGDGKITATEATGLMKKNFKRVDSNKDGGLDKNELTQLANRLRRNNQNPQKRQTNRRRIPTNEELIKNAPNDVVIEPDIVYRKGKSEAWKLDLVMPKAKSKKARAAIVFVHGGGWRSGDKRTGYFMRGAVEYAQKGYVCITVNYRLIAETPMPASIEDVKCAVRWLRANAKKYNVDPKRIGAYGNSAGAHLVCMLGLVKAEAKLEGDGPYQDQSSLVQAVCASATPTNFLLFDNRRKGQRTQPGELFAGPVDTLEERGKKASPSTYVAADAPPFLRWSTARLIQQ